MVNLQHKNRYKYVVLFIKQKTLDTEKMIRQGKMKVEEKEKAALTKLHDEMEKHMHSMSQCKQKVKSIIDD